MAGWLHFQYADDCQAANPTYGHTAPYGCNNNWGNIGTTLPADFSQIGYATWSKHCYMRVVASPPPTAPLQSPPPLPPSPPPLPPDYGCWQASALSESCDTRCASLGGCSGEDTLRHKNEIDSHAEVKVLFESLTDETCGSPTQMYTWDTVPLFYQSGNMHCMGKTGASSAEDFNCGASSTVAKRLCWCSSCASPPPFAPGAVPPAPPPPAYVKLQTDGECQGWSLTPSVCYPNSGCSTAKACQDLCDQSDKCGATTFMQYSADSCATRARARAPAPAPPKLHSPAPHLPVSPLPVLTLAAPLRGRLVALPVRG